MGGLQGWKQTPTGCNNAAGSRWAVHSVLAAEATHDTNTSGIGGCTSRHLMLQLHPGAACRKNPLKFTKKCSTCWGGPWQPLPVGAVMRCKEASGSLHVHHRPAPSAAGGESSQRSHMGCCGASLEREVDTGCLAWSMSSSQCAP